MDDGFCYLTCPKCRREIEEPFSVFSGPITSVHRDCGARLIVTPSPTTRYHEIREIPDNTTLERELTAALIRAGVKLGCAA
jgi:hypothetical protein